MEQTEIKIRINELEKVLKESYGSHHWINKRLKELKEELQAIQVQAKVSDGNGGQLKLVLQSNDYLKERLGNMHIALNIAIRELEGIGDISIVNFIKNIWENGIDAFEKHSWEDYKYALDDEERAELESRFSR